jgi:hypothetical protein
VDNAYATPDATEDPPVADSDVGSPALLPGDAPLFAPADFNFDGFVNSTDLGVLEDCSTSPEVLYDAQSLPAGCTLTPDLNDKIAADFDKDGDVDHDDYGFFQKCHSGTEPADSTCAD